MSYRTWTKGRQRKNGTRDYQQDKPNHSPGRRDVIPRNDRNSFGFAALELNFGAGSP